MKRAFCRCHNRNENLALNIIPPLHDPHGKYTCIQGKHRVALYSSQEDHY